MLTILQSASIPFFILSKTSKLRGLRAASISIFLREKALDVAVQRFFLLCLRSIFLELESQLQEVLDEHGSQYGTGKWGSTRNKQTVLPVVVSLVLDWQDLVG